VEPLGLRVPLHVPFNGVHELRIATRWNDFDALGHLNHAVYHVYCDEARDAALRTTVGDFDQWPNVVVHASIDYRREIPLGTREIVVRTRIVEVGRSSVRFEHSIDDGAAEASAVLAAWDPQTRKSRVISVDERDALTRLIVVAP
jgi:YbgC/YbaW family acyl-CoA thioester hydrolase